MRLAAATVIPLVVLGSVELGLRLAGFGYPTGFFLPSRIEGRDYLIPNFKFSYRFFPPALAREPVLFRMSAVKPEGAVRIFLFGESAAYGDPDPSYGAGRYLEVLLEERYPATDFEVICVAMTAINSHAILPIARECARHQGDLWVVYMGNNEMVGPYGAGTVFGAKAPRRGAVRAMLALKTTRMGQLLDRVLQGVRRGSAVPPAWTGIDMFTQNPLRADDPARRRAYENFRGNLRDLLRVGREAGVPILLSTVACNLADCSPFLSQHAAGLDAEGLAQWDQWFQQGQTFETAGSYPAALEAYSNAAALDAEFAELAYRMGACHLALTNRAQARARLEQARDQDALAVRADTRINRILSEEAARVGADGRVVVVDAAGVLAGEEPDGLPGRELFYEHVHFTLEGNYRLARIFAGQVAGMLPASVARTEAQGWAERDICDRLLGVTLWDQQRLWKEALNRIAVPPFTSQSSHGRNLQSIQAELRAVGSRITQDSPTRDRKVYEEAVARRPEDALLRGNYGQFLEVTGSRREAIAEGRRICKLLPDLAWPHYYLGALLVREGRMKEAAACFERALAIRNDFTQARSELRRIQSGPGL
ncbi:MAG: hypothetical protein MUE94_12940 [Verrucomicrobia bacterium]|jgi:tetratricopeptide (TPR) repeat protein|nr:hypothetical protein [Verrucomicrobiota bacterium]